MPGRQEARKTLDMQFEWDGDKARETQRKHRVSVEEAAAVFDDPFSVTFLDPALSVSNAISKLATPLAVASWSLAMWSGRIRIISCRQATRRERMDYEKG